MSDTSDLKSSSLSLLARLVGFDTTSYRSNLELLDFCTEYLAPLGFRFTRLPNEEGTKANLFASIGPEEDGGIVLSGHTDVVPVADQDWLSDPFNMTVRGPRAFGRGTADMKGFLACILAQAPRMARAGLKRPIHFALSYDEEVGCTGVGSMIDHIVQAGVRPTLVIVGEPTRMGVVDAHKSISSFFTRVTGVEAHSSRTHEGVSAIAVAARLITFLEGLAEEMRERGDPGGRFTPPYTTLNIGQIDGGTAVNIIAHHCEFAWEYRSLPTDDSDEIYNRFTQFCDEEVRPQIRKRSPKADIATRRRAQAPGLKRQGATPAEALMLHLAARNTTEAVSYATEGGLFQAADIPTFICGPGDIAQAHRPDEFIDINQLAECERMLRRVTDASCA